MMQRNKKKTDTVHQGVLGQGVTMRRSNRQSSGLVA
jgi:hypothetical protein